MTPIFSMKLAQTRDMNCGPLSLTTFSEILKYLNTCWNSSSAVAKADGMAGSGLRRRNFEKRSMITSIVVFPCDSGKSVMKSRAKWDHGHTGIGRGTSLPAGRVRGTLAWVYVEDEDSTRCTSLDMWGHQYFLASSWWVRWIPRWPVASAMWAQVMSSSRYRFGTNCLPGGHAAGIRDLGKRAKAWSRVHSMALTIQEGARI